MKSDSPGRTVAGTLHHVQLPGTRPARYLVPTSIDQALRWLADEGDSARVIAGGTDLLVELDRNLRPEVDTLIDLSRLRGLDTMSVDGETLRLGPMVTHAQVVSSTVCVERALPLAQACLEIGSPQLRNRATVAGNLVTASPANDTISALLALGASVTMASTRGIRTVALDDFFTGFRSTVIEPDELIVDMAVPMLNERRRGIWVKLGNRRAQAISVIHVGVVVESDADGVVSDARIALGSVAPTVVLGPVDQLIGRPLDQAVIEATARGAAESVAPIDDVRATADYRSHTLAVVVRRALGALAAGAEADRWPTETPLLRRPVSAASGAQPVSHTSGHSFGATDEISVRVNGSESTGSQAAGHTLLEWLGARGFTGTKEGCAEGECGACTVQLDGTAVMSCLVPAARADGATVTTVEGLAERGRLSPLQQAFIDETAVQCGYCIPGFLVAGSTLLDECPTPTDEQIVQGLAGNLCRCTGYYRIIEAMRVAAAVSPGEATSP